TFRKVRLSDVEILMTVIDVHVHFTNNGLEAEIPAHYMMQQSTFKFGLDIGVVDVARYLAEQARAGKSQYMLLAAVSQLFLKYSDAPTLKLNFSILCKTFGIPSRDDRIIDEIIERWNVQKQYGMK